VRNQKQCWVRCGVHVDLCFGELVGTLDYHAGWADYPCVYCDRPIKVRDWWWNVPDHHFLPPALRNKPLEYGWCTDCVSLFRVRPRDVPRELWLDEMWERGAGDRWPDWPIPDRIPLDSRLRSGRESAR
jgi:hypothetical protein